VVEPITLAASIALARAAIKTAKDVTEIGSAINAIFHHQERDNKPKPKANQSLDFNKSLDRDRGRTQRHIQIHCH